MQEFKVAFVVGYSSAVISVLAKAVKEVQNEGFPICVQARAQEQEIEPEFWNWLKHEADAVVLNVHPTENNYKTLKETLSQLKIPIFSIEYAGEQLSRNVSPEALAMVSKYFVMGGKENLKNLLLYLANYCGRLQREIPLPKDIPWCGIYHPDSSQVFNSLSSYKSWYRKNKGERRYKVGILFWRNEWVEEDLSVCNALIREFENRKVEVVPVFTFMGLKGGAAYPEVEQYDATTFFMEENRPYIDLLVDRQGFFLVSTPSGIWVDSSTEGVKILKKFNIPVINAITPYYKSIEEWRKDEEGIDPITIAMDVSMPEVEGIIEPIVVGGTEKIEEKTLGGTYNHHKPIKEQVEFLVERALRWIRLKEIPSKEKKVAIILHNNPCASVEATVGMGFGLDTMESVVRILKEMRKRGYHLEGEVPRTSKELADTILGKKAIPEFRWTPISEVVKNGGAADLLDIEEYLRWFEEIPEEKRREIIETWGDPYSLLKEETSQDEEKKKWTKLSLGLYEGKIVIPGLKWGNVFLCIQPKRGCAGARCDGQVCKILHDPSCPPPHQWIAVYKWIDKVFKADIIVHVGTHGYLEFLPGKGCGLSPSCYPQISIGTIPHLYIYNIDNPMEGITAKRRSYATIIDHLTPVMKPTEAYGELDQLEELLDQYQRTKTTNDKARLQVIFRSIVEKAKEANLYIDFSKEEELIEYLHGKLTLFRETQIRDGLHIFGQAPEGEGLVNLLVAMMRFDAPNRPSIRRVILESMGLNYDKIVDNPTDFNPRFSKTNGELLDLATHIALNIMKEILKRASVDTISQISDKEILEVYRSIIGEKYAKKWTEKEEQKLLDSIRFGISLIPKVQEVRNEMKNLFSGFEGTYIEPGPAGSIIRGRIDVLPTGRNFYAVDPLRIPTPAAWQVGMKLAEELIKFYKEKNGSYPENIGFVEWCIDPFRADGEGVAQILYTMGTRPVWDESGVVKDVEVIPLKELGRPRIDCTIRVDGIFRDTMPNLMELIDKAVRKVAFLDEPLEHNFIKKHVIEMMKILDKGGEDRDKIFRKATYRVFSEKPGTVGDGVNYAVYASAWKEKNDLAEVWIDWGSYAYGEGVRGESAHRELVSLLKSVNVTYEKLESDDFDTLDCCCFYGYHGGFTCAAETVSGKKIEVYFGDTRDPERPSIREMKEEMERTVRTKLLNPAWIEGKKRHGYKGAVDISERVGRVYGWAATADIVENWVFDGIVDTFVADKEMRKWFEENNPWAFEEIARRLLEAAERGIYKADEEHLKKLKEAYLEIEGFMEERLGDVEGDFQGGEITILTREDVKSWDDKAKGKIEEWKKIVEDFKN